MYRALLHSQWKSTAPLVFLVSLVAFAIPLLQVLVSAVGRTTGAPEEAIGILATLGESSGIFPIVAYGTGGLVALATWQDDWQGKHIYALALPVPRWYYLLLRIATGMTYIGIPVAALWLAALIATAQITLPPALHAYPTGLAVRFALAAALSFSVAFAFGAASQRVLRWIGGTLLAVFVISALFAVLGIRAPLEWMADWLVRWPGVLDVFTGRWLLIDV